MSEIKQLTENIHLLCFDFTEQIRSHLYLIHDQKEAVLIDAHIGPAAEKVLETIEEIIQLDQLKTVILTHGNMDHIGACPLLEEKTDASIAIHIADAQYIEEPWTQFLTLYQDIGTTEQAYQDFIALAGGRGVKVSNPLHEGDTITVGSIELQVIHTPGHFQEASAYMNQRPRQCLQETRLFLANGTPQLSAYFKTRQSTFRA